MHSLACRPKTLLLNQNLEVTLAELEIIVRSSGALYGDRCRVCKNTGAPACGILRRRPILGLYYNTSSFAYQLAPIGEQVVNCSRLAGRS